jgi:Helix-turn-helix
LGASKRPAPSTLIGRDDAAYFLQLSAEEGALIDIRLSLVQATKQSRVQHALSQTELAKRMQSSQSRIAKIEAVYPSVSIDLVVRARWPMVLGERMWLGRCVSDVERVCFGFTQTQFAARCGLTVGTQRH